jgi:site-specific recombinase XerD
MAELKISIQRDTRKIRKKPYLVRWHGAYDPHTSKQRRYSKSFAKRKEAERFVQAKQDELEAGLSRDEVKISLNNLCEKFIKVHQATYTAGTLDNYRYTIERLTTFFNPHTLIQHIRQDHAEEFIAQIEYVAKEYQGKEGHISDSARNIQLRNCKKIFNKAVEWKFISYNPFGKLKQVKATTKPWHRITVKEFKSLMEHAPTLRIKGFFAVMYGCGLRSGEALNLLANTRNIDFETNQIHLFSRPGTKEIPQFLLKDKEARSITMPRWVKTLLQDLYKEHDPDCPFLFLTPERWQVVQRKWAKLREAGRSREWQNNMLMNNNYRNFQTFCTRAGIQTSDKLCLHCLRKSWACNLAENGIAPKTLCELGGWSNPSTLHEYYTRVSDANRDKARQVLDDLMRE